MKQRSDDTETGVVTTSNVTPSLPKANATLERESQGCSSVLFYMIIFLMLDVWKQITSYGMKYYNNNRYPVAQTKVVAVTESAKFSIFFFVLLYTGQLKGVRISWWYALPSFLYAINNNVYYFALNYVTPPIWNIIIQLRVLFTALTYRLFFKKEVTPMQWGALTLLIAAIVMTNLTGGNKLTSSNNFSIALCLAVLGSMMSVFGTVVMEYLFKNDQRPFAEMQLQLYLFSGSMAWIFYMIELYSTKEHVVNASSNWTLVIVMVAGCIVLSCTSGISVAFIVKKLDNIVKLYSQALSNMLTSIACTLLFPDHFHLNFLFVLCLALMFVAIIIYENKNWTTADLEGFLERNKGRIPILLAVLFAVCVATWFLTGSSMQAAVAERTSKRLLSANNVST